MTREEFYKELEATVIHLNVTYPNKMWQIKDLQDQLCLADKLLELTEWMPKEINIKLYSTGGESRLIGYYDRIEVFLPIWMFPKRRKGISKERILRSSLYKLKYLTEHRINYLANSVTDTELVFLGKLLNLKEFTEQE